MNLRFLKSPVWRLLILFALAAATGRLGVLRAGDSLAIVDALVLYTPAAARGEPANFPYWLQTMVDLANDAFLNSDAPLRLRVLQTAKVSYEEVTPTSAESLNGVLHHLIHPADGHLDDVNALRERLNADVVILVTSAGTPAFAAPLGAGASNAFVVVNSPYDYTLAKGLGRLAGCGPGIGSTQARGLFDDSRALSWKTGETLQWGTLMNEDLWNLTVFSNPSRSWQGHPLGQLGVADNVRVLRMRAGELAGFRPPTSQVEPAQVQWVTPDADRDWPAGQPLPLELAAAQGDSPVVRVEILERGPYFSPVPVPETGEGLWKRTQRSPEPGWHHYVGRVTDRMGWVTQVERAVRVHAANDDFANRQIVAADGTGFTVALNGSSLEPGESERLGTAPGDGSVWFRCTPSDSGNLWIASPGAAGLSLTAWFGDALPSLTSAGTVTRRPEGWSLAVEAGRPLTLAFSGPATLAPRDVKLIVSRPADNDRFERRHVLTTTPARILAAFDSATSDPNFPWPEGFESDLPTLWWTWIPERSGIARIHFPGGAPSSGYISVFRGTSAGQLTHFPYPDAFLWAEQHHFTAVTNLLLLVQEGEPVQIAARARSDSLPFAFRIESAPAASNHVFAGSLLLQGPLAIASLFQPGSTESGAPASVGPLSLWYRWKAPESGSVFLTSPYSGAARSVFVGDSLETLQAVPTSESSAGSRWDAVAGTTYTVVFHWKTLPSGGLFIRDGSPAHLGFLLPNTRFQTRQTLTGPSGSVHLRHCVAPYEPNPISAPHGLVWYRWVAPESGTLRISKSGALGQVSAHSGTEAGALLPVPLSSDGTGAVSLAAQAGVEYQIAVGVGDSMDAFQPGELSWSLAGRPGNDAFAQRTRLGVERIQLPVDLSQATLDPFEQQLDPLKSAAAAVWWSYTAPRDGVLSVFTPQLGGVFRLRPEGTLEPVDSMDGWRRAQLLLRAGDTVEIAVGGTGTSSLVFSLEPLFPDDPFHGRPRLHPDDPPWFGSTQGRGSEVGEPPGGPDSRGHSAWAGWQAGANGVAKLVVDLEGPVEVTVYRGNQLENLVPLQVARGTNAGQRLEVSFYARAGEEFAFRADALGATDSGFILRITFAEDGPVPSNDAFAQAIPVHDSAAQFTGSTRRATATPGEPRHAGTPAARSLWWKWTAPGATTARFEARPGTPSNPAPLPGDHSPWPASPNGLRLAVYTGTSQDALVEIASATADTVTQVTRLEFAVVPGTDYLIALDVEDPDRLDDGEFTLHWFQAPSNDDWARRVPVSGVSAILTGTLAGAARATTPWGGLGPPTVWWSWVAPINGHAVLHDTGAAGKSWEVYRGIDSPRGTPIASGPGGGSWSVTVGETFSIAIRGNADDFQRFQFELEAMAAASNDAFGNPRILSGERAVASQRCEGATLEPNEPTHGSGLGSASLWYLWTAPRSGWFRVATEARPELLGATSLEVVVRSEISVYRGSSLSSLTRVAPDGGSAPSLQRAVFFADAGTAYRFAVGPVEGTPLLSSNRRQYIHIAIAPAAANLDASTANVLTGTSAHGEGDLQEAADGLWWKWTAPRTGPVSLLGVADGWQSPGRRLAVSVWNRPEGSDSLQPLLNWSDSWEDFAGPATFPAESGREYWIRWNDQLDWNAQTTRDYRSRQPFTFALNLIRTAADSDAVRQAEPLGGTVAALFGDFEGATREAGEPLHGEVPGLGTLWWQWTAPSAGICTLRARFPIGYLRPGVYRIPTPGTWEPVAVHWESAGTGLTFETRAGGAYGLALESVSTRFSFRESPVWLLTHAIRTAADEFKDPAGLVGDTPVWITTTRGATAEPGEPEHGGIPAEATVWARWIPRTPGRVQLETSSAGIHGSPIPRIAVYRGDTVSGLTWVGDNVTGTSANRTFVVPVEAGVPYRIAVNHAREDVGAFRIELKPVAVPANDAFADRAALHGIRALGEGSNRGATTERGEPLGEAPAMGATLWWSWTAPAPGTVLMQTVSPSFDTVIAVYRGDRLDTLTRVATNDDRPRPAGAMIGGESQVSFEAEAGVTYQIQVGGVASARGLIRLQIFGPETPAPALVQSPQATPSRDFLLQFQGVAGQRLWLETSNDLVYWTFAAEIIFRSEWESWREPVQDWDRQKFYRVVVP